MAVLGGKWQAYMVDGGLARGDEGQALGLLALLGSVQAGVNADGEMVLTTFPFRGQGDLVEL